MVRKILTVPNAKLTTRCSRVAFLGKKTRQAMRDLKETLLFQAEPEGAGLAAPQLGVLERIFVMKGGKGQMRFIINPEIIEYSKETIFDKLLPDQRIKEGCLSLPGIYEYVNRPWEIKVRFKDDAFLGRTETLNGFEAEVFQHEYDHLEGILFTSRVLGQNPNAFSRSSKSLML